MTEHSSASVGNGINYSRQSTKQSWVKKQHWCAETVLRKWQELPTVVRLLRLLWDSQQYFTQLYLEGSCTAECGWMYDLSVQLYPCSLGKSLFCLITVPVVRPVVKVMAQTTLVTCHSGVLKDFIQCQFCHCLKHTGTAEAAFATKADKTVWDCYHYLVKHGMLLLEQQPALDRCRGTTVKSIVS